MPEGGPLLALAPHPAIAVTLTMAAAASTPRARDVFIG